MKVYFIAICGKGVGNLAVFLKQQGHDVLGSEYSQKTFYPPIADLIKEHKIHVDFGFDPEKITPDIDLVILGGAAFIHDPSNPQVARAKELGIKIITTARGIGEFISKEEHISVVGNHGKTTTTSIIASVLQACGEDVSYFIGEAPLEFSTSIYSGSSKWSVAEGDEHPSLGQEPGGKFLYHKPKHVTLTSADWDHKNIYTTEDSYIDSFVELINILPRSGRITACIDGTNVLEVIARSKAQNPISFYTIGSFKKFIRNPLDYNFDTEVEELIEKYKQRHGEIINLADDLYYVSEVDYQWSLETTRFLVKKINLTTRERTKLGYFETNLIGQIGLENSLAAIATTHSLGFNVECIKDGISKFRGTRRRLELIYNREYKVIDDFAHSPIKIASSLQSIRTKFYNNKIFVIFQVGQSGLREKRTFRQLSKAFNLADYVIIPRVIPALDSEYQFFGKDYRDIIKEGAASEDSFLKPNNVYYAPIDTQIRSILENNLSHNDVIVIMSSSNNTEIVDLVKGLRVNQENLQI